MAKLPRKIKKAHKNWHRTKRVLLYWLRQTDYIESHCKEDWCYVGPEQIMTFADQRKYINEELKHPYPATKWIRKVDAMYRKHINIDDKEG